MIDCRLEIALAPFVRAITIEFQGLARAFTRRAAVLAAGLRGTSTNRVLTFFFFFVCHALLLNRELLICASSLTYSETRVVVRQAAILARHRIQATSRGPHVHSLSRA